MICRRIARLAVFLVVAAAAAGAAAGPGWTPASPDYSWSFPEDHWAHPAYRTEWWYLTGHLTPEGETRPRFGFQFTFFRVGLAPLAPDLDSEWNARALILGHASITDLARGSHTFTEVLYRAIPLLGGFSTYPDSLLAWSLGPPGTSGRWELRWNGDGFDVSMADDARGIGFTLSTRPAKPRIFQGPGGYSRKGEGPTAASLYYSFPRLRTEGEITAGGERFRVTGTSWMDKELGSNQLDPDQVGWDWFSLQLDDGREVMLYLLRDREGRTDFTRGTLVARDGSVRYFTPGEGTVRATGSWESPHTGIVYPSGWEVSAPELGAPLRVEPELDDQENVSAVSGGVRYWEGAVRILDAEGETAGRGYVELTGYGAGSRPAL